MELYDMEGGTAPALSAQPANLTAIAGSTAMFSASAVGAVGNQWQRLPAGSSAWVNLSEGNGFFGTTTASLLASASAAQTGDQFRVVVTNFAGVTRSNPVSFTVAPAPTGITVAGFTAPTVAPMSLITVNATGLTPAAVTFVEFANSSGAVVAQVPPVAVTATSVSVAVPPLIGSDGASLVSGTLTARIVQLVGTGTVASNTFTAAQLQAAPASKSSAGALTLSLLQAELDQANALLASLSGSSADDANTRAVVSAAIQSLQNWNNNVSRAMSSGTSTFALGSGTGPSVTLTQRDLQAIDNALVAILQTISTAGTSATMQPVGAHPARAAADAPNPYKDYFENLRQAGLSGASSDELNSRAKQLVTALLASPDATAYRFLLQQLAAASALNGTLLISEGLSIGAPVVSWIPMTLLVGGSVFTIANGMLGLAEASTMLLNHSPNTEVQEAIDRRNGFLDAIATRGNPSPLGTAMLLELNGPGTRGFAEIFSGSSDSAGDFLRVASDLRHTSLGRVAVAPPGTVYPRTKTDSAQFLTAPSDPADAGEAFLFDSRRYFSFSIPFTLSAVPLGSSVFTGWRMNAPFYNATGSYQAAGRDATIALQMVRGGYFVIATFDLAHTLTLNASPGNGGSVEATPAATRYPSATGTTPPSYLRGDKVTLTAKESAGYAFTSWSALDESKGDTKSGKTATVIMTADRTVTANFSASALPTPPVTYTLTITKDGTGSGTVTATPSKTSYTAGESVTLTAAEASGSTFNGWSVDASGTARSVTVTMDRNRTVTATFNASSGNLSRFNGGYLGSSVNSDGSRGWDVFFDVRNGVVSPSRAGGSGTVSASGVITFSFSLGGRYDGTLAPDASGVMKGGGTFTGDVYSGRAKSGTWSVSRIRID